MVWLKILVLVTTITDEDGPTSFEKLPQKRLEMASALFKDID